MVKIRKVLRRSIQSNFVKLAVILFVGRLLIFVLPLVLWGLMGREDISLSRVMFAWNRWDAPHFIDIAREGYVRFGDHANFIVFPPLYPITIKIVGTLINNYAVAAVLISHISFVVACLIFYRLVCHVWGKHVALQALFFLNIFPTSYFFSAPYTESLFVLMACATMYATYKKQFFYAGLFGGLAFLTRHPGIFLYPAVVFAIYMTSHKKLRDLLLVTLPFSFCVGVYLFINWYTFGDPLMFRIILENHWQKKFALPWDSLYSSWKVALGKFDEYSLQVGIWEAIPATVSLLAIPLVWKSLKNNAWAIWYTLTVLFICSTSFLLSTPRYLVSLLPLFVALGILSQKHKGVSLLWNAASAGMMAYFTMRFVSGQWAF